MATVVGGESPERDDLMTGLEPTDGGGLYIGSGSNEIDVQIATARKFPRSPTKSKQKMITYACMDKETAGACSYYLERKGKDGKKVVIEGPSIRLAEIAMQCWGNLRAGGRVVGEERGFIIAEGVCHDLESNVACRLEVPRRITYSDGRRYKDDMIGVTGAAAASIALRNAICRMVPKAVIEDVRQRARAVAYGDQKTLLQSRQNAIAYFAKLGVTPEHILTKLGRAAVEDIDLDDIYKLGGIKQSIIDNMTTVEQEFDLESEKKSESKSDAVAKAVQEKTEKAAEQQTETQTEQQKDPSAEEKTELQQQLEKSVETAQGKEPDEQPSLIPDTEPTEPANGHKNGNGKKKAETKSDTSPGPNVVSQDQYTELRKLEKAAGVKRENFKELTGYDTPANVAAAEFERVRDVLKSLAEQTA